MSSEYAFRKIDIDAFDEDVLLPSDLYDPDPRGPDAVTQQASQKAGEARGLVSKCVICFTYIVGLTVRGDIAGALNVILTDTPYGEGVDEAKVGLWIGYLAVLMIDYNDKCSFDDPQFD